MCCLEVPQWPQGSNAQEKPPATSSAASPMVPKVEKAKTDLQHDKVAFKKGDEV